MNNTLKALPFIFLTSISFIVNAAENKATSVVTFKAVAIKSSFNQTNLDLIKGEKLTDISMKKNETISKLKGIDLNSGKEFEVIEKKTTTNYFWN